MECLENVAKDKQLLKVAQLVKNLRLTMMTRIMRVTLLCRTMKMKKMRRRMTTNMKNLKPLKVTLIHLAVNLTLIVMILGSDEENRIKERNPKVNQKPKIKVIPLST